MSASEARATSPAGGDWPTFHANAAHTGYNSTETILGAANVASLGTKWMLGPLSGNASAGSPVVANGIVYQNLGTALYALDAKSGQELWSYGPTFDMNGVPAVADGVVFSPTAGTVNALNATTGAVLWSTFVGGGGTFAPLTVADGVVLVPTDSSRVALDVATGTTKWQFLPATTAVAGAAVANGVAYTEDGNNNLYAINDATGALVWSATLGPAEHALFSPPAVQNGVVYAGGGAGNLYAVSADTGTVLWTFQPPGSEDGGSSPAVANGTVFVGDATGHLWAVDAATGLADWSQVLGTMSISASPAVANGVVYITGGDSQVRAIDAATGAILWSSGQDYATAGSPAIVNGLVYVAGWNDTIWAFGLSATQATSISVGSSRNPSIPHNPVTYTASVSPLSGGGTVSFADGGTPIGGCTTVPVRTVDGTATFSGHSRFDPSGPSRPVLQNVVPAPTARITTASGRVLHIGRRITGNASDGGGPGLLAITLRYKNLKTGESEPLITTCAACGPGHTSSMWSYTLATGALPAGAYSFTAQAIDVYGNVGPVSTPVRDTTSQPPRHRSRTQHTDRIGPLW